MIFLLREEGQGLVEYGLILILVAVAVALALALLGTQLSDLYSRVAAVF